MDPQACFARWLAAAESGDRAELRDAANDYNAWRARGGFRATSFSNPVESLSPRSGSYVVETPAMTLRKVHVIARPAPSPRDGGA